MLQTKYLHDPWLLPALFKVAPYLDLRETNYTIANRLPASLRKVGEQL
jgi:hypothetical protein